jgi:N-methylhydantoinase A
VRLEQARLGADAPATLRARFEQEYHRLYERTIPGLEVELLSWVMLVSTPLGQPAPVPPAGSGNAPEPVGRRELLDSNTGEYVTVPVYAREALAPGAHIEGPAVIVETDTATVLSALFVATIHPLGYIIAERRAH